MLSLPIMPALREVIPRPINFHPLKHMSDFEKGLENHIASALIYKKGRCIVSRKPESKC